MKKLMMMLLAMVLSLQILAFPTNAETLDKDFGAASAITKEEFTLEEMMKYAIEDEYLARDEYLALIEKFSVDRPFTNIVEAEERHIDLMEELYKQKGIEIPEIKTEVHIPETLEEVYKIGIDAEIANIAMYEKFLSGELPEDVRETFTRLMNGSKSHLRAFERNYDKILGNTNNDKGNAKGKNINKSNKRKNKTCHNKFNKNKGRQSKNKSCKFNGLGKSFGK